MLAAAGARLGLSVDRIDHLSGEVLPGTSRTRIRLEPEQLAQRYAVITAELEHLLGNPLVEQLAAHPGWRNGEAMRLLPARQRQKALLDALGLPTAPWREIHSPHDLRQAQAALGPDRVVKSMRGGYDGKGQWLVTADGDGGIPAAMFGQLIAEQQIRFRRELSLVGARFADGEKFFYPLVENHHHAGMLRHTLAPAAGAQTMQPSAEAMLGRLMDHLNYVGVMAAECFDTPPGLLINEIAPRVHNSGHWTQLGADLSQFDLHLLALLGKPPPPAWSSRGPTLMLNLIGCRERDAWRTLPGMQCWWYGKSFRENRKLGHINIGASSLAELTDRCRVLRPHLDAFHQRMLTHAVRSIEPT